MEDRIPILIEDFISLIEGRPILWDKSLDHYKNKIATQNAWKEILLIMYPDFETWDEKKRQEYDFTVSAKKTVKKWTHIRDTFMKSEKKIEGQKTSGSGAKTAKPYVYHKQLLFLKKNIRPNISASSIQLLEATNRGNTADVDSAEVEAISDINEDTADAGASSKSDDSSIQNNETQVQPNTNKAPVRKRLSSNLTPIDAKMIKFMDSYSSRVEPINRHVSFFNGLIPTLDKFNDDQIIDFQLGVIQLMKNIKNSTNTQSENSSLNTRGYFTSSYVDNRNTSTRYTYPADSSPVSQDSTLSNYSDDCTLDFTTF